MKVTITSKRCKGCIFWQKYAGTEPNAVMRKIKGDVMPASKSRACLLVLRLMKDADGEVVHVPVRHTQNVVNGDVPGPRFGERIGPNGTCDHHTAKHSPVVLPPRVQTHVAKEHVFQVGADPFASCTSNQEIPFTAID